MNDLAWNYVNTVVLPIGGPATPSAGSRINPTFEPPLESPLQPRFEHPSTLEDLPRRRGLPRTWWWVVAALAVGGGFDVAARASGLGLLAVLTSSAAIVVARVICVDADRTSRMRDLTTVAGLLFATCLGWRSTPWLRFLDIVGVVISLALVSDVSLRARSLLASDLVRSLFRPVVGLGVVGAPAEHRATARGQAADALEQCIGRPRQQPRPLQRQCAQHAGHSTIFVVVDKQGRLRAVFESLDNVLSEEEVTTGASQTHSTWEKTVKPRLLETVNALLMESGK